MPETMEDTMMSQPASPPSAGGMALGRRAQFLRGLRCASPLVLLTAAALAAVLLFVVQGLVVRGTYRAIDERHLLRSPKDDYTHIAYLIAQLRAHPPQRLPVYYIGGSATRESIRSGETLADALSATTGIPTEVHIMGSKQQTLAETLAIVDNLPPGPAVVTVGLNRYRFRISPQLSARQLQGIEFLLASPSLRSFAARTDGIGPRDRTLIPGIANYMSTWLRYRHKSLLRLRLRKIDYQFHLFDRTNQLSDARKAQNVATVRKAALNRAPQPDAVMRYNLDLLRAIAETARARGFQVVFFEVPRNKEMLGDTWSIDSETYTPFVAATARQCHTLYLDLNLEVDIPNEHFADLSHLLDPGRLTWERHLAPALAPFVTAARNSDP